MPYIWWFHIYEMFRIGKSRGAKYRSFAIRRRDNGEGLPMDTEGFGVGEGWYKYSDISDNGDKIV